MQFNAIQCDSTHKEYINDACVEWENSVQPADQCEQFTVLVSSLLDILNLAGTIHKCDVHFRAMIFC